MTKFVDNIIYNARWITLKPLIRPPHKKLSGAAVSCRTQKQESCNSFEFKKSTYRVHSVYPIPGRLSTNYTVFED